jgi:hypothetical protein
MADVGARNATDIGTPTGTDELTTRESGLNAADEALTVLSDGPPWLIGLNNAGRAGDPEGRGAAPVEAASASKGPDITAMARSLSRGRPARGPNARGLDDHDAIGCLDRSVERHGGRIDGRIRGSQRVAVRARCEAGAEERGARLPLVTKAPGQEMIS